MSDDPNAGAAPRPAGRLQAAWPAVKGLAIGLGVPLVTAFHVTRVVVLLTCTAPVFAWLR